MPDQPGRRPQGAYRVGQIGHEPFGADRMRIVDVSAPVPRRVVGVDRAQPVQPAQLPRPGAAPPHQAVHQHQRLTLAATAGQQVASHVTILRGKPYSGTSEVGAVA